MWANKVDITNGVIFSFLSVFFPLPPKLFYFRAEQFFVFEKLSYVLKLCMRPYVTKIQGFQTPHKIWGPPFTFG